MEANFFCVDCGSDHGEPADARLGFLVVCLGCAMIREHFESLVVAGEDSGSPALAA